MMSGKAGENEAKLPWTTTGSCGRRRLKVGLITGPKLFPGKAVPLGTVTFYGVTGADCAHAGSIRQTFPCNESLDQACAIGVSCAGGIQYLRGSGSGDFDLLTARANQRTMFSQGRDNAPGALKDMSFFKPRGPHDHLQLVVI